MLFYLSSLLIFIYFKIARVHKKEEILKLPVLLQHILVALSAFVVYYYGFTQISWYLVLLSSLIFFILAALMITAVQLGIFVDGKPQLGISSIYKYLPVLTSLIIALSAIILLQNN